MWNDRYLFRSVLAPPTDDAAAAVPDGAAAVTSTPAEPLPSATSDPGSSTPSPAADGASSPSASTNSTPAEPAKGDAPASTSLIGDADAKAKEAGDGKDAPAPEAKPDAEPAKDPAKETKPDGEKPKDDAAKDDAKDPAKEAAKAEVKPEDVAAAAPVAVSLADVKLPDEIKLAEKESKAFFDILNDGKLEPKARAQGLIDLYLTEVDRISKEVDARQRAAWDSYNLQRKSEVKADTEVGGNRMNTALSMAKAVIEEYGGSAEQRAELFRRLDEETGTGMGNDVFLIRLLNNIGRKLNVFEDGVIPANPTPPKAARTPGKRGWYDEGPKPNGASA